MWNISWNKIIGINEYSKYELYNGIAALHSHASGCVLCFYVSLQSNQCTCSLTRPVKPINTKATNTKQLHKMYYWTVIIRSRHKRICLTGYQLQQESFRCLVVSEYLTDIVSLKLD